MQGSSPSSASTELRPPSSMSIHLVLVEAIVPRFPHDVFCLLVAFCIQSFHVVEVDWKGEEEEEGCQNSKQRRISTRADMSLVSTNSFALLLCALALDDVLRERSRSFVPSPGRTCSGSLGSCPQPGAHAMARQREDVATCVIDLALHNFASDEVKPGTRGRESRDAQTTAPRSPVLGTRQGLPTRVWVPSTPPHRIHESSHVTVCTRERAEHLHLPLLHRLPSL